MSRLRRVLVCGSLAREGDFPFAVTAYADGGAWFTGAACSHPGMGTSSEVPWDGGSPPDDTTPLAHVRRASARKEVCTATWGIADEQLAARPYPELRWRRMHRDPGQMALGPDYRGDASLRRGVHRDGNVKKAMTAVTRHGCG
jgi:hypothetical protein